MHKRSTSEEIVMSAIEILKKWGEREPDQLEELRKSSKEFIEKRLAGRIFNGAPNFINDKTLTKLSANLKKIIANCQYESDSATGEPQLTDAKTKKILDKWVLGLIEQGSKELLDSKQLTIKKDIADILHWPSNLSLIQEKTFSDVMHIVCGFVFSNIRLVDANVSLDINYAVNPSRVAVSDYLHKSCQSLVATYLVDEYLAQPLSAAFKTKVSQVKLNGSEALLRELDKVYAMFVKYGLTVNGSGMMKILQNYRDQVSKLVSQHVSAQPSQVGYFKRKPEEYHSVLIPVHKNTLK
jgi:hypothetical protein